MYFIICPLAALNSNIQFYEHSDTLLSFTDNAHEYYQRGSVAQRRKILEIISEKITCKDKSLNISLKPVFQTIAEKQYNLRSKLANNRTQETSIKKGLEPNSNPDFINGSSGEGLRWQSSKTIENRFALRFTLKEHRHKEPMEGRTCEDCAGNPSRFESVAKNFCTKKEGLMPSFF